MTLEELNQKVDFLQRMVENGNNTIYKKLELIEHKIEDALWEADGSAVTDTDQTGDDIASDEEIKRKGQQVAYRRFEGEAADKLREFIFYIRSHPNLFNVQEYTYAGYADKTFDDLRLSSNTFRTLNNAYKKTYGRGIPFPYTNGHMYKYLDQKIWEWDDEK